jgi:putative hydrolase of the HAD superfamily
VLLPIDNQKTQAVLFDAGGTLLHVDYQVFVGLAGARGYPVDVEAIRRAEAAERLAIDQRSSEAGGVIGADANRVGRYFRGLLATSEIPAEVADEIAREVVAAHRAENLWRVPLPDAIETLRGLRKRGVRTAVVSNADGRVERALRAAGLTEELEFVVDSHFEGVEKPDPEIFRRALARLQLPPERVAYIGDIYSIDAVGARAAGLSPVIIDPTNTYHGLDCPIIRGLRELMEPVDAGGS